MLLSTALVLIVGLVLGGICKKVKLPSLIGMLVTGIVLGPYVLDMLDPSLLAISADLRKIALIIILTRAGLSLDISGLRRIGRPAIMMCFVPATFELAGMLIPDYLVCHCLNRQSWVRFWRRYRLPWWCREWLSLWMRNTEPTKEFRS